MRTILFVDDEQPILKAVERMYHERSDIRLLFAESGAEALKLIEQEEVWVVVSDYLMPGMRGVEFLARVKAISPPTVRIMMTAYADLSIAIDAINKSEAYRFVTKPWVNKDLMDIVDEALMRYQMVKGLGTEDETVYFSLAQTVELKDPYTKGHCDRVASFAVKLARAAGLEESLLSDIKHGGWLHDCGKIGVPELVLNFPGRLDTEQMAKVMMHPQWGAEVARQARMSETVVNIIMYHHERYDGKGYPVGLAGEQIPIEARIVGIADVFDALYSDRPYRKAYLLDEVMQVMDEMTPTHFDASLMALFRQIVKEEQVNE